MSATTKVLGKFLVHLKTKRQELVQQEWILHWDNAAVHTSASVKKWFVDHNVHLLLHPPPPLHQILIWRISYVPEAEGGAGWLLPAQEQPQKMGNESSGPSLPMSFCRLLGIGLSTARTVFK
jgi:hypothetical protein